MAATVDALIAEVRLRLGLPDGDGFFDPLQTGSEADLRTLLDGVMANDVAALMRIAAGSYQVKLAPDIPIVANVDLYDLPERAMVGALRRVLFLPPGRSRPVPLDQLDLDDQWEVEGGGYQVGLTSTRAFVFLDAQLRILPFPTSSRGAIRLYYYRRFSRAILSSDAAQIVGLPAANQIQLTAVPAAWQVPGTLLDTHRPADFYQSTADDLEVQSSTPTVITLTADYPAEVKVGDWISLAHTTPVVEVPEDLHQYVVWAVALEAALALGDPEAIRLAGARAEAAKDQALRLLKPRAEGNDVRIVDRSSAIRRRSRGWRW